MVGFVVGLALLAPRGVAAQPRTAGSVKGALVLVGGGANRAAFIQRFVDLAGGAGASIVVIPTTLEDARLTPDGIAQPRMRMAEILWRTACHDPSHTGPSRRRFARVRGTATTGQRRVDPRRQRGIPHGRLYRHAHAGELRALLARGGVVGGTSAGAIIQGSAAVIGKGPDLEKLPRSR
jgi:cyanophycinase